MFFVPPQIKLNKENLKRVLLGFSKKPDLSSLQEKLSFYFSGKQIVFTDMGRSSFKVIIEKLNLQNSEILLPAFLCDIFYPILKKYNIKPIFLDINIKTFNIRVEEIKEKFTPETKAILVCHTFGLPFKTEKMREVGRDFLIIEDCAHSFGAKYQGNFVGNFGKVSFFSIYKQFPTFRGGFLVCPKDWEIELPKTSFNFRDFISFLNSFSFFAFLFKTFGQNIAPRWVRKEKMPQPAQINPVSLSFFSQFFGEYEKNLKKRINLALLFQEKLRKLDFEVQESKNNVFCYLSALIPKRWEGKRDKFVQRLRKRKVFCTRIWHDKINSAIIFNPDVQKEYELDVSDFPNTVEAAKRMINFPLQNHYQERDIKKMVKAIKKTLNEL